MDTARAQALTVALTASERERVQHAAAAVGQTVEEFMRTAVLEAAHDPFRVALEQAAETIAARGRAEQVQHDYAH
ncbi:hypothetical protein [Streptomyces griseomycini]|uniref:DUF1778 domain-containing protein n=1 Tax=Streptomyces griseomycini TaxID=66895 RepID=A0A7W7PWH6_9ACTN|nr:hypothetical protein [Streptomyces griseomycini]MBB4902559.1 hypothetical protein [Streptomyces griseomycini]GGR54162.1 hypothetical protein GCM10015536_69300 [Streptomyces griseomycini]